MCFLFFRCCIWPPLRSAVGNGACLSTDYDVQVGVTQCPALASEDTATQWTYTAQSGHLTSVANSACITSHGSGTGRFMVDEFGSGELTFFGSYVTDFCVAAC